MKSKYMISMALYQKLMQNRDEKLYTGKDAIMK